VRILAPGNDLILKIAEHVPEEKLPRYPGGAALGVRRRAPSGWPWLERPLAAIVVHIIDLEIRVDREFFRSKRLLGELFARFTPQPNELEEDVARQMFALVQQMDADERERVRPTALTVFRHYCIDNLSIAETARKCRCSTGTVANRVNHIRKKTGMEPARLRTIAHRIDAREFAAKFATKFAVI